MCRGEWRSLCSRKYGLALKPVVYSCIFLSANHVSCIPQWLNFQASYHGGQVDLIYWGTLGDFVKQKYVECIPLKGWGSVHQSHSSLAEGCTGFCTSGFPHALLAIERALKQTLPYWQLEVRPICAEMESDKVPCVRSWAHLFYPSMSWLVINGRVASTMACPLS